jgi:predicted metal-dependent hydrolase
MSSVEPIVVHVAGRAVEVWPKISERSTRVKLSVKPGPKIVLSYPPHTSQRAVLAFLNDQIPWLEQALNKTRATQPHLLKHFSKFNWVTIDDRMMSLQIKNGGRTLVQINHETETVDLTLPKDIEEQAALRATRRLAETGLNLAVSRLAKKTKVTVGSVSVRDQTSRWGSCSSTGTLSLNWRLILLPPLIHDHVILHELAHRLHMNHSDRFWNQLAQWDPEWKKHDRELTKRWSTIMDLGHHE